MSLIIIFVNADFFSFFYIQFLRLADAPFPFSLIAHLPCSFADHLKNEKELAQEKQILNEMLDVVEQRDALVALLEEQRLREKEEDKDLEAVMLSKGFNLNWV